MIKREEAIETLLEWHFRRISEYGYGELREEIIDLIAASFEGRGDESLREEAETAKRWMEEIDGDF